MATYSNITLRREAWALPGRDSSTALIVDSREYIHDFDWIYLGYGVNSHSMMNVSFDEKWVRHEGDSGLDLMLNRNGCKWMKSR
jgi:hypothetical protein